MSLLSYFSKSKQKSSTVVGFIDCASTVSAAKAENSSICDYVESLWGQSGQTQKIINEAAKKIDFSTIQHVCEIGPGTGRYIEKTLELISDIKTYAIYETAEDWAAWLSQEYHVSRRETDGKSLAYEKDASIDLCHAHGVFVALSMYNTLSYIEEMIRVTRNDGFLLFDFLDENSFKPEVSSQIIAEKIDYPSIIPAAMIKHFLKENHCTILSEFPNKYSKGESNYILAQKKG